MNYVQKWSTAGFIIISVLGVLLHYAYELSGKYMLVGLISPVNESIWEHLKLGLWALILFSCFEFGFLRMKVNNYFLSKALGILTLSLSILVIHYSYRSFIDHSIIWMDIISYFIGVLFCQLIAYRVFYLRNFKYLNLLAVFFIAGICILFAVFSYYPPKTAIFKDAQNGTYGIYQQTEMEQ